MMAAVSLDGIARGHGFVSSLFLLVSFFVFFTALQGRCSRTSLQMSLAINNRCCICAFLPLHLFISLLLLFVCYFLPIPIFFFFHYHSCQFLQKFVSVNYCMSTLIFIACHPVFRFLQFVTHFSFLFFFC